MSLEQKIEGLTLAVERLIKCFEVSSQVPVTIAPVVASANTLGNGMPGGPFGTQPAPVVAAANPFAAPAAPGAPFGDLVGATKYAVDTYHALEAKQAGRGEVITQLIRHLCGSDAIDALPAAAYPEFYAQLEKQKAA